MTKPSGFGRGRGRFGDFGAGRQIRKLPNDSGVINDVAVTYGDFRGGFDSRQLRDGTPANASIDELDVDINGKGRLVRLAGTSLLENLAHPVSQMVMHPSYDGWSELVMFGSPWFGVRSTGSTKWTNIGLRAHHGPVKFGLYGDQLVFSDGSTKTWIRKAGEDPKESTGIPVANSYATFAARLFVGGVSIDGQYEPMGMGWSGTSGDPEDFEGPGSGFELLIDDPQSSDRVICQRTMGLGLMGILCRHSIWLARFTGLEDRPADFEPRVVGAGIRDESTARATPRGIIYLSDDGVRIFDGNSSIVISEKINGEILPLSTDSYSASFDPNRNRYSLHTPTETWVYDLTHDRWLKSSLRASAGILFSTQIPGVTWEDLNGTTWEQLLDTTWQDMERREADDAEMHYVQGNRLDRLDPNSATVFGAALQPRWSTPQTRGFTLTNLVQTKAILVEYVGEGQITLSLPDINSRFTPARPAVSLLATTEPTEKWLPLTFTGQTTGVKIQIDSGLVEIVQIQLITQSVSPKVNGPTNIVLPGPYTPQPTDAMVRMRVNYINGYDSGAQESLGRENIGTEGVPKFWTIDPTGGANGKGCAVSIANDGSTGVGGQYSQVATYGGSLAVTTFGVTETRVYKAGMHVRWNLRGQVLTQPMNCMAFMATMVFTKIPHVVLRILPDRRIQIARYDTGGVFSPLYTSTMTVPANDWYALEWQVGIAKFGNPTSGFSILKMYTQGLPPQLELLDKQVGINTRGTAGLSNDTITGFRWGTEVISSLGPGLTGIAVDDVALYGDNGDKYRFLGDTYMDIMLPRADGDIINSTIQFDGRKYFVTGSQGTVTVGNIAVHGVPERYKNLAGVNSSLDSRQGEVVKHDLIVGEVSSFTGNFLLDPGQPQITVPPTSPTVDTVVRNTVHENGMDLYKLTPPRADAVSFEGVFPFALTAVRTYLLRVLGAGGDTVWNWTEVHGWPGGNDVNYSHQFVLRDTDGSLQSGRIGIAPFTYESWRAVAGYIREPWSFINRDSLGRVFTAQSLTNLQAGMKAPMEFLQGYINSNPVYYSDPSIQFDIGLFGVAYAYHKQAMPEELDVTPSVFPGLVEYLGSNPTDGYLIVRNTTESNGNTIISSVIDWKDGSIPEPIEPSIRLDPADSGVWTTAQHNYTRPGTYTPTLYVTDQLGRVTTASLTITVVNKLPSANFSMDGNNLTITFADLSVDPDGYINAWAWDFGDGNLSTVRNPTHTYAAPGTYNVKLQVTDIDGGVSPQITVPVTVPIVVAGASCPFSSDPVVDEPWVMGDDFAGGNPPFPAYVNTAAFRTWYWGTPYREWYGTVNSSDSTGVEFELDLTKIRNGHPCLRMSFGKNPVPPSRTRAVGAGWSGDMTDDDPVTEHYYTTAPFGTFGLAARIRAFWQSGVMSDATVLSTSTFSGLELFSFFGRAIDVGVFVRAGHLYLDVQTFEVAPTGAGHGPYVTATYDLGPETDFFADRTDESAGELGFHYQADNVANTVTIKIWLGNMCELQGTAPLLTVVKPAYPYAIVPNFGSANLLEIDSQSYYNWLFWPDADPNKNLWHVDAKIARLEDNPDPFGYLTGGGGGGPVRTHFDLTHFPSLHFGDTHFT